MKPDAKSAREVGIPLLGHVRAWRLNRKFGPSIITVSGLPRSGTSMMMLMLSAAGLEVMSDEIRQADEDNPKGYFEDERVKDLDRTGDKSWLLGCRGKVIKIISFLLKDLPDEHHYKVIFMHRDLQEIIASQNKMLARRGESAQGSDDQKMMKLYENHLRKVALMLHESPNFDCIDVSYKEVLGNPRRHAKRVAAFLGRRLNMDEMAEPVDRSLYRNRRTDGESISP